MPKQSPGVSLLVAVAMLLCSCGGGGGSDGTQPPTNAITATPLFSKQGFVVPWFSLSSKQLFIHSINDAIGVGANTIILDYEFFQTDGVTGKTIVENPNLTLTSWSAYITYARSMGVDVWVKPLVAVGTIGGNGFLNQTADWTSLAPADVAGWFAAYQTELLKMGGVAEHAGASVFIIGNEMATLSTVGANKPFWLALIAALRADPATSSLKLTYQPLALSYPPPGNSAEYQNVTFWAALDFACIESYPLLVKNGDNSVAAFKSGWTNDIFGQNLLTLLANFATSVGKDIYMTELGSPAVVNGNYARSISNDLTTALIPYDLTGQASFFDASLQALRPPSSGVLKGVFIYNWQANPGSVNGFVPSNVLNPNYNYTAYAWNLNGKPLADAAIQKRLTKSP